MDEYEREVAALINMLDDTPELARYQLRQLSLNELNTLAKALDDLAAEVDDEAIGRVHNPREADMRS